ncbi:hypothetical protein V8E55_010438 [Tylopilus felleus]
MYLLANGWTSIIASWIYTICFTCLVTLARMSILFSIIRVIHGSPCLRAFTYACVAFFAACWIILIVEKVLYDNVLQTQGGTNRHLRQNPTA